MTEQPETYNHLEFLKDALIEERRNLMKIWAENRGPASFTAGKVKEIQECLAAVKEAMKEERQAQGIVGFIG